MSQNSAELTQVRFPRPASPSFSKVLRQRVNSYFKENNISKKANAAMRWKTLAMLLFYFVPYVIMFVLDANGLLLMLLFLLMGLGMAGVGMSVMHDAVHGAYSSKEWVNRLLGSTIYFISGNATTWRLQHNVLHHTFTNIEGMDDDLETKGLLRLHPSQPFKKLHRYQAWYAPLLYGLLTLNWVISKDFSQLIRYNKQGVAHFTKAELRREWLILVVSKLVYFTLFPVLPLLLLSAPWWLILIGFVAMHWLAGVTLSFVFQLAHVVPEVETFDIPNSGTMEDEFMEHQLRTTANFSKNSPFISWFVGGLNYQIEHHLFPNICHIHYPKISGIVKQTAQEFGLPYYSSPSFFTAMKDHFHSLQTYSKPTPNLA